MKTGCLLMAIILFSCGGSLSDEQRKQMREKMEANRIVRVTEAEIMDAAFEEGREVVHSLDSLEGNTAGLDAYRGSYPGQIHFITPGQSTGHLLEQQLIDAYLADPSSGFQDNVQEVRNESGDFDTLLYTKPVMKKRPDGSDELVGVWNIWLPKKELVIQITRDQAAE
ncbi:MAG: hypothetical protein M3Y60_00395 [Bacteroidota bacterium]|nr:hypothetical protein [Bacteroidota bacterium]